MKTTFAIIAGLAAAVSAQGVTSLITPTASAPQGCATSQSGAFEISAVNVSSVAKRHQKRADCSTTSLAITLDGGVLKDQEGRTGYIAANHQFQFDAPPQTGAIYTGGFSVCGNGSLAIGGTAVFYQCLSGTFYNLYDASQGDQCVEILIQTSSCDMSAASSGAVGQSFDGQPTGGPAGSASSAPISQISDGQPQAPTSAAAPITQISDGQPQAPTSAAPVSQISDGQVQASTAAAKTTGAPVSQISDGQVQASTAAKTTGAPVSQISDGQVQASTATGAPVSQISDGQVQASTATGAPVSQISDGQVQASTSGYASVSGGMISQISDGQVQATGSATASSQPVQFTGAANVNAGKVGGSVFAVAVVAVALL